MRSELSDGKAELPGHLEETQTPSAELASDTNDDAASTTTEKPPLPPGLLERLTVRTWYNPEGERSVYTGPSGGSRARHRLATRAAVLPAILEDEMFVAPFLLDSINPSTPASSRAYAALPLGPPIPSLALYRYNVPYADYAVYDSKHSRDRRRQNALAGFCFGQSQRPPCPSCWDPAHPSRQLMCIPGIDQCNVHFVEKKICVSESKIHWLKLDIQETSSQPASKLAAWKAQLKAEEAHLQFLQSGVGGHLFEIKLANHLAAEYFSLTPGQYCTIARVDESAPEPGPLQLPDGKLHTKTVEPLRVAFYPPTNFHGWDATKQCWVEHSSLAATLGSRDAAIRYLHQSRYILVADALQYGAENGWEHGERCGHVKLAAQRWSSAQFVPKYLHHNLEHLPDHPGAVQRWREAEKFVKRYGSSITTRYIKTGEFRAGHQPGARPPPKRALRHRFMSIFY